MAIGNLGLGHMTHRPFHPNATSYVDFQLQMYTVCMCIVEKNYAMSLINFDSMDIDSPNISLETLINAV